jgi:hypothetical protein
MRLCSLTIAILLLVWPSVCTADRIHLKSGWDFDVDRWYYEGDSLYYERFGGVIAVKRSDVVRIEKSDSGPTHLQAPGSAYTAPPGSTEATHRTPLASAPTAAPEAPIAPPPDPSRGTPPGTPLPRSSPGEQQRTSARAARKEAERKAALAKMDEMAAKKRQCKNQYKTPEVIQRCEADYEGLYQHYNERYLQAARE